MSINITHRAPTERRLATLQALVMWLVVVLALLGGCFCGAREVCHGLIQSNQHEGCTGITMHAHSQALDEVPSPPWASVCTVLLRDVALLPASQHKRARPASGSIIGALLFVDVMQGVPTNMTCFPTFFLIGAQKAGTTALQAYVRVHLPHD